MNAPVIAKKKSERSDSANTPNEVRAAYPYFHEKRTKNSAGIPFTKKDGTPSPRHSSTLMFPKLNADPHQCPNYMFLWGLACQAAQKMWPHNIDPNTKQWTWPEGAQYPVKDGDVPFKSKPKPGQPLPSAEEVARKNAWRNGYWILEVENFLDNSMRIVKMIGGQAVELPTKSINGVLQYKSGDWGFANVHAYAYENETFGVNFGIDGFLFTREGEAIGSAGPKSATQMFGGVIPAGATVAQAPGAAPAMPPAPAAPGTAPLPPAAPAAPQPPAPPAMTAPPLAPAAPVAPPAPPAPPMPGATPLPAFPAPPQ